MTEAALTFLAFAALGVLLGRGWETAALGLCLTLIVAVSQVAS